MSSDPLGNLFPYTITYPANGTSSVPYTITYPSTDNWQISAPTTLRPLVVQGDAEITGDLKLDGVSLTKRFDKIEQMLGIVHSNLELEKRWQALKELGEQYRALERELIEKEKIWNTLKGEK